MVTVAAGSQAPGATPRAVKVQDRTLAEWITQARHDLVHGKPRDYFVAVVYAAVAARRSGLGADACPFDAEAEAKLHAEWHGYFRLVDNAVHRESRGTGARAEFQSKRRTSSRRIGTRSAAYAEQCGAELVEEP